MKDLVKRAKSFVTFDSPFDKDYITSHFLSAHRSFKDRFPNWSLEATIVLP
jgi:hypothetical protein